MRAPHAFILGVKISLSPAHPLAFFSPLLKIRAPHAYVLQRALQPGGLGGASAVENKKINLQPTHGSPRSMNF